jgi:PAS domain S-box-containing protein
MSDDGRFSAPMTEDSRYRLLVEAVTDYAIYMLDPEGRVSSWNAGAQRFKGYTSGEIIGEHFSRFYTDEDRAFGLPGVALTKAVNEGKFEGEGWRLRKDGSRFWAHVVIDPIRHADGTLAGFAKITRDLTERKAAEASLKRTQEQFKFLVQSVTDYSIYMLSPQGIVSSWNQGAARIKGYRAEEILGQHFSRFYTEEDRLRAAPEKALETALRQGKFETEGWRCRKDGSRFRASVVIDPVFDEMGQHIGFAKITRDITEAMETQQALAQAREALMQSQKMEAVGQLTGGLAHDFNNLLAGIMGNIQLAKTRIAQGKVEDIDRYLTAAEGASKRAAALTHRLLAFSRRQTLDPKPTDLNELIAGMEELINRTMGPEITVAVTAQAGLWNTIVDPNQLENTLLNLCINARDAMPEGGNLKIAADNRVLDDRAARARGVASGDYVSLSVTDTGTGMSEDVLERAFEPFYTTKPIGMGTGLGLSMVYGFAKQSGGQAEIKSEPGKGTSVCLYLPRHLGEAESLREDRAADALAVSGSGEVVLVVDDEPTIRMLIAEVLEELGYTSIEAEDGIAGLEILQASGRIDLLISDVGLPGGINGRQLADAGLSLRPELKVLFITGYAEMTTLRGDDLRAGMHVLAKPFDLDTLASRIQDILVAK